MWLYRGVSLYSLPRGSFSAANQTQVDILLISKCHYAKKLRTSIWLLQMACKTQRRDQNQSHFNSIFLRI